MNHNERHWFSRALEKLAFVLLLAFTWLAIADIFVKPLVPDASDMQSWYWLGAQLVALAGSSVYWLQALLGPQHNPSDPQVTAGWLTATVVLLVQIYLHARLPDPSWLIPITFAGLGVAFACMAVVWES